MKKLVLFITIALCVAFAGTALAATSTGTINVSATVAAAGTCTVGGVAGSFGGITPPISANIEVSNTGFTVTCPTGTPYSVALSTGDSDNFAQRLMSEFLTPTNKLSYNIYTDATFTSIWGDGTGTTAVVNGTGTAAIQPYYPGFRVPPQATPAAGSYADLVTITVTY